MSNLYEKKYDLRAGDFDKFNHIKPSSVLELFQDVAGRHGEEIGVGYEAMQSKSYFWVLVRIKFQIISQPERSSVVVVKTWPLEPNKFIYRREYCIENEDGEKLIIGSSEWVVIDSEKRRMVSAPDLYTLTEGFCAEMNFGPKLEKIENFEPSEAPYSVAPGFCEIDVNNHVNNTKYANFVMDAINPDNNFEINGFAIEYRKEVLQGTRLEVFTEKKEDYILAKGVNEKDEVMFACKIECK